MISEKIDLFVRIYLTGTKIFPFCQENYQRRRSQTDFILYRLYTFLYRLYVQSAQILIFSIDWGCSHQKLITYTIWMVPDIEQANLTRRILHWDRKLYGE